MNFLSHSVLFGFESVCFNKNLMEWYYLEYFLTNLSL